jgi:hypothetical protein
MFVIATAPRRLAASIGWGVVLNLSGRIDDDFIILEKSRGAIGNAVLQQTEIAFQELFPGGKQMREPLRT